MNRNPAQRTRIKICGLTREQDVDAAIAAGVDAVGFVLYEPSPRYVSVARAAQLAQRLPPFVTPVLLFVNEIATKIIAATSRIATATAQFHGEETPEACLQIGRPFIRAARMTPAFDLLQHIRQFQAAQAILLDAYVPGYGGGGQTFDWSLLPAHIDAHLVLSGGLTAENVADGIAYLRPRCKTLAVDVSSGVEIAKGIKSAEKIRQFVAAVRAADARL